MKFAELFLPVRAKNVPADDVRNVRNNPSPSPKLTDKDNQVVVVKLDRSSGDECSASSAPLTPLDSPWTEGARYRIATATEWPSRLDLYVEDESGPWIRLGGGLVAVSDTEPTIHKRSRY